MNYAIIPIAIYHSKDLKPNDKLLFGLINSLTRNNEYCYANNDYFSKVMYVSKRTITSSISNLKKFGFIRVEYEDNHRKIYNNVWKDTSRGIEDTFYPP